MWIDTYLIITKHCCHITFVYNFLVFSLIDLINFTILHFYLVFLKGPL